MKILFSLTVLLLMFSCPTFAGETSEEDKISRFQFQGVFFGDFPAVDMICVRGLCPVGSNAIGVNTNPLLFPTYNQQTSITHYHGAKISSPEFTFYDDKMFMVSFYLLCSPQSRQECFDAVKNGMEAQYGLTPYNLYRDGKQLDSGSTQGFLTESGSLVELIWRNNSRQENKPVVRISDKHLLELSRKSVNPQYIPPEMILQQEEVPAITNEVSM